MPKLIPEETKRRARELRRQGVSVNAIATQLGLAKSTVSLLVRDIPLTEAQQVALDLANPVRNRRIGQLAWSRKNRDRRRTAQLMGRKLAELGDPDYTAGVMLYWAEGAKARNQANIANSDPELLRLWLGWLDRWYMDPAEHARLSVNCHLGNGLELREIEDWWLEQLGLPRACLRKSVVNRPSSASKGVRKPLLHGTAHVAVHSTFLIQSIYGAIQEIGGFERPEWLDLGVAAPAPAA